MSWIKEIEYKEATGKLKKLYDRVKGPDDNIDNILKAHSLRPHSLTGHMTLYKNVLHHTGNSLPKWYLETLGVYVSSLNHCDYCVLHHSAGLRRLLADDKRADEIEKAVKDRNFEGILEGKYLAGTDYAKLLTESPTKLTESSIGQLRVAGFSDGEILEINQVVSYFNYANRTVLGLGVNIEGDILGLSPSSSDEPDNWNHAEAKS